MKTNELLIFTYLFFSLINVNAQTNIKGIASILNSDYNKGKTEYVKFAEVKATKGKAVPTQTDSKGRFKLIFSHLDGNRASISVRKPNLLLVNQDELQNLLPEEQKDLRVVMATSNQIENWKSELETINFQALSEENERVLGMLQKKGEESRKELLRLESKYHKHLKNTQEGVLFWKKRYAKIKSQLPSLIKYIIQNNLDFQDKSYVKAYEKGVKNGDIEKAIELLNSKKASENLAKNLQELTDTKNNTELKLQIQQNLNTSYLRYNLLMSNGQFEEAIIALNSIIDLLKDQTGLKLQLIDANLELARAYWLYGDFRSAILIQCSLIEMVKKEAGRFPYQLAQCYHNLAQYLNDIRVSDKMEVFEFHETSFNILIENNQEHNYLTLQNLAKMLKILAIRHLDQKRDFYESIFTKTLTELDDANFTSEQKINLYESIGDYFFEIDSLDEAQNYYEKAVLHSKKADSFSPIQKAVVFGKYGILLEQQETDYKAAYEYLNFAFEELVKWENKYSSRLYSIYKSLYTVSLYHKDPEAKKIPYIRLANATMQTNASGYREAITAFRTTPIYKYNATGMFQQETSQDLFFTSVQMKIRTASSLMEYGNNEMASSTLTSAIPLLAQVKSDWNRKRASYGLFLTLSKTHYNNANWDAFEDSMNKVIDFDPVNTVGVPNYKFDFFKKKNLKVWSLIRREKAEEVDALLQKYYSKEKHNPDYLILTAANLLLKNKKDQALVEIKKAMKHGFNNKNIFKNEPVFEELKTNPEFKSLME
ncbi:tetratricopeptide repeat protein [Tenacibaculum xiamenense]|uniref:tetratricopeptide repeat protein n=1 Tax=Tenacibaculum xiamenense TaxID=1261553 RepID=UPI003895DBD8